MTRFLPALRAAALACGVCAAGLAAHAQTIRIASQGDAISLDPHAYNESVQQSLTANVYEPLVGRNKDLSLAPLLATSWTQTAPTVWRFALRPGVRFQDGAPFTADDMVFSFERAAGAGSDLRGHVQAVAHVRAIDAHTVEIDTRAPYPLLPDAITQLGMMPRAWTAAHDTAREANGTGPYVVRERVAGVRTVFERNPGYWGSIEGNAQRVVFTPLPDPAARVAALLAGQVDLAEPVPVQDIARINAAGKARVVTGPELRTIFLGMDQWRDELPASSVHGRNPFKDRRVRQAFYLAIDIGAITKDVLYGAGRPAALLVGPGVNGWTAALDKRLPFDVRAARALMAEAGYPDGFALRLDCPQGRYVNDLQTCQAVAASLAKIGVRVEVAAEPKERYFARLLRQDTGFYLLGWTPGTFDAYSALEALAHCRDGTGAGQYNLGGYCNPALDALLQRVQGETDRARRSALIGQALALHASDVGHLPLFQQSLAWGVAANTEAVQLPDNQWVFKWMKVR